MNHRLGNYVSMYIIHRYDVIISIMVMPLGAFHYIELTMNDIHWTNAYQYHKCAKCRLISIPGVKDLTTRWRKMLGSHPWSRSFLDLEGSWHRGTYN